MTKFRKKPVTVEAVCFDGVVDVDDGREPLFDGSFDAPGWLIDAMAKRENEVGSMWWDWESLYIRTMEGVHRASANDWIIRGVQGELYPCKPDIFEQTYEVAE